MCCHHISASLGLAVELGTQWVSMHPWVLMICHNQMPPRDRPVGIQGARSSIPAHHSLCVCVSRMHSQTCLCVLVAQLYLTL